MDLALSRPHDGDLPDLIIKDGDFVLDNSLSTPVLISLFSDARAGADDDASEADLRGWWGEALEAGDSFGSLRWLLERRKQTPETASDLRQADLDALAWLVADGLVSRIDVDVLLPKTGVYEELISLTLPSGATFTASFNGGVNGI